VLFDVVVNRTGDWLLLKNLHLVVSWLPELEKAIHGIAGDRSPSFRLFLASQSHAKFPQTLLERSNKVRSAKLFVQWVHGGNVAGQGRSVCLHEPCAAEYLLCFCISPTDLPCMSPNTHCTNRLCSRHRQASSKTFSRHTPSGALTSWQGMSCQPMPAGAAAVMTTAYAAAEAWGGRQQLCLCRCGHRCCSCSRGSTRCCRRGRTMCQW
jgi:hypothetical protein